jgi:uncharacterized protein YyaL (SSP411 family)
LPLIKDVPAGELSPYLRQHRTNPVNWYPWGDDAFDKARQENRPIFLSIGYSACHWCHVMAHESFEDPVTADVLNSSFVSIKVDREERPDVDAVYMEAVQAMTGSGGWPMSMFLTPDRRPFFGGTYFPPDDRNGTPSFRTVLKALTEVWENRRDEVEEQANELSTAIASRSVIRTSPGATSLFATALEPTEGGGARPDLMTPAMVDLALWRSIRKRGDSAGGHAELMAATTLDGMAAGGIHDHLGGGFARYATDHEWLVPHFEKMLYDQAGLLRAFLHGWLVTGRENYRWAMDGIVDYVSRDLTTSAGGVCSAEDADSEGVEGRFYVWSPEQISRAITEGPDLGSPAMAQAVIGEVSEWFGVTEGGNFEGASILRRPISQPLRGSAAVEAGRARLLEARASRVRPGLDDKVLTEWNAMYGSALAEAAAATGNRSWGRAAVAIGEFLDGHLLGSDGRWRRSWQPDGGARHLAYASDYAWLIDCFTRLGELTGQASWTERAVAAADGLLALFHDDEVGGFFTTGTDAEALIVRAKEIFDGATPSANAVAALALARLGSLTGIERYTEAARGVVDMFGELLTEHPMAFAHTALTADLLVGGLTEVVVTGDRPDLLAVVRSGWRPDAVVAWGEPTSSPLWRGRDGSRAYVCQNYTCQVPADDAAALASQLGDAPPTTGVGP